MRNLLVPLIGSYILLLNSSYAQQISTYPAQVLNLRLNQIQFKATHNSYQRDHVPVRQIDQYNVWEIELDFGVPRGSSEFIVGHDCPQNEPNSPLYSLRDWVLSIKSATALEYHPIILKLEAKTSDSSGLFGDWCWAPIDQWGNWQDRLFQELQAAIGLSNWFTSAEFNSTTGWPSIQQLAGKFIISLQDNNKGKDIQDPASNYFFIGGIPQLMVWPPPPAEFSPIKNPTEFGRALRFGANRLIMDDGYHESWSNVLVYPPLPSWVDHLLRPQAGGQWGTILEPFQTIGHAINASWTRGGAPTHQVINIFAGNYSDKVTISTPAELHSRNGTVIIGGKNVAYTITLTLMDEPEAGTDSPVYVRLRGVNGSTTDYPLKNPETYLDRAGAETFWITAADVGVLQSITVGVQGRDDIYFDDIIVVSATTGWKKVHAGAWIGDDNGTPKTFNF